MSDPLSVPSDAPGARGVRTVHGSSSASDARGASGVLDARGGVACAHPLTAATAAECLADGGNAADAAVAAGFMACVVEPLHASLAAGGLAVIQAAGRDALMLDFAGAVPSNPPATTATQAVPGLVAGLFSLHKRFGSLPLRRLMAPAIAAAMEPPAPSAGDRQEAEAMGPEAVAALTPPPTGLPQTLETLVAEGPAALHMGRLGAALCAPGSGIAYDDLTAYRAQWVTPLHRDLGTARLAIAAPPSHGGAMVGLALDLAQGLAQHPRLSDPAALAVALSHVLNLTEAARQAAFATRDWSPADIARRTLDPRFAAFYRDALSARGVLQRGGTSAISILDGAGNAVALNISLGARPGPLLEDTGIRANTLLAGAVGQASPGSRIASPLSPGVLTRDDGQVIVFSAAGGERIVSALTQILARILLADQDLIHAIAAGRLHWEGQSLHIEGGFPRDVVTRLREANPTTNRWEGLAPWFARVCAVSHTPGHDRWQAVSDPRGHGAHHIVA